MGKSITQGEYFKANLRLEELIDIVNDSTPLENPLAQYFLKISDIIEQYEEIQFERIYTSFLAFVSHLCQTPRPL